MMISKKFTSSSSSYYFKRLLLSTTTTNNINNNNLLTLSSSSSSSSSYSTLSPSSPSSNKILSTTYNNRNIIYKYNNIHYTITLSNAASSFLNLRLTTQQQQQPLQQRLYSSKKNKESEHDHDDDDEVTEKGKEKEEKEEVDEFDVDIKKRESIRKAMQEKVLAAHQKSMESVKEHSQELDKAGIPKATTTDTTTSTDNTTSTASDTTTTTTTTTTTEEKKTEGEGEKKAEEETVYDRDSFSHFTETNAIYTAFGAGIVVLIGLAIRGFIPDGSSLTQMPYDHNLILRDIFDDYHALYQDCEEFNKIIPPTSTVIIDKYIQVEVQKDTLSFTIPILQKSSMSLVATYNIDFYKSGDVFKCSNLYLDVVNGKHFDIDHPNHEYDTTSPKYTLAMLINQQEQIEKQKKLMDEKGH